MVIDNKAVKRILGLRYKYIIFLLISFGSVGLAQDTKPVDKMEDLLKGTGKEVNYDIIFEQDFEHHSAPIEYSSAIWNPDWNYPGWRDGDNRWPSWYAENIKDSIVVDPATGSKVIKFNFKDTIVEGFAGHSPNRGGDYWKVNMHAEPKELYLSYNVKFRPGWVWNEGGKLPATNGGSPLNKATQDDCVRPGEGEGYSSALMWQSYGGLSFYLFYQEQAHEQWGETVRWDDFQPEGLKYDEQGRFVFDTSKEEWYNITMRVVVNSFTNGVPNKDGIMEGFINGKLIEQVTGLYLLTETDIDKGVNQIALGHFFGGNENYQGPKRDEWSYFDDFFCFTYADHVEGIPRANVPSSPGRILDLPYMKYPTTTVVDQEKPSVPQELKATRVTDSFVSLEWEESQDNIKVEGYKVYINDTEVANANTSSKTIEGLTPQVTYAFTVSAYDMVGNESDRSEVLNITSILNDTEPPSIPTGLLASDSTQNSINIFWNVATDNDAVDGYYIFLDGKRVGSSKTNSYSVLELDPNSYYNISVSAYDLSLNESAVSEPVNAWTRTSDSSPPTAPTGLRSTLVTQNSISIEWDESMDNVGVTGYYIDVNGLRHGESLEDSYTIQNLKPGILYSIIVKAHDYVLNESAGSEEIFVSTRDPDNTSEIGLPEVEIVDFLHTPSPNMATTVSEIASYGHTELVSYGLLVAQNVNEPGKDIVNEVVYANPEFSEIQHVERVVDGLGVMYDFTESNGVQVMDNSGTSTPIDLAINNPIVTAWLPAQGLKVDGNTVISSQQVSSEFMGTIKSLNEITVEAWIRPSEIRTAGPAQIISLSENKQNQAFSLAQSGNNDFFFNFTSRLNTTSTPPDGLPEIITDGNFTSLGLYHVVYRRAWNGSEKIFVNGVADIEGTRNGNFTNFTDNYKLVLGNSLEGDQPWSGTYYLVAVYNRALTDSEISQNYSAGLGEIQYTTDLVIDPNQVYQVTPFAKTDQGIVLGETKELLIENVVPEIPPDSLFLAVYPNPSNGDFKIYIQCSIENPEPAYLRISNMMGQIVYTEDIDAENLVHYSVELSYSLSSFLTDGIYSLTLIVGNDATTKRLIIRN